jgi:hypothetical protein
MDYEFGCSNCVMAFPIFGVLQVLYPQLEGVGQWASVRDDDALA